MFQILIPDRQRQWGPSIAFVWSSALLAAMGQLEDHCRRRGAGDWPHQPEPHDDSNLPLWPRFAITAPTNRQQIQPAIDMSRNPVMTIRRALLSVSDKTGLEDFARCLEAAGVEILSTGGTAHLLREADILVTDVASVTGFPEIMDGRVKTLHPKIHGGLLAKRDNEDHLAAMETEAIEGIDLLVVNLYPFEATLAATQDRATLIENIDIGGPAMLRAAAKNHEYVTVACDPADYPEIAAEITATGKTSLTTRQMLAAKTFARTAAYDTAIASWMAAEKLPEKVSFAGTRALALRYGENPHQEAALYRGANVRAGVGNATRFRASHCL